MSYEKSVRSARRRWSNNVAWDLPEWRMKHRIRLPFLPRWPAHPPVRSEQLDIALPFELRVDLVWGNRDLKKPTVRGVHLRHLPVARLIKRAMMQDHTLKQIARRDRHLN